MHRGHREGKYRVEIRDTYQGYENHGKRFSRSVQTSAREAETTGVVDGEIAKEYSILTLRGICVFARSMS